MTPKFLILLAALPLALSACGKNEDEAANGSNLSIDLSDDSKPDAEKIRIGGDGKDSKFSIRTDGFSMDVDLPTSARSTHRSTSFPACTVRRSSSAARPRSWVSPR